MPFQTSTNNYQISKYIVDAIVANSPYNSIQAAMDAANTAGVPTTVFVRAGTFTEDLTFYDGISLNGDNEQNTIIIGTHTPPAAGNLNLFRCVFQSATDIFNSAAAGTTDIIMEDCGVIVTNGYTFNLPNWTGSIAVFDIGNGGTNDGFLNNTAGAAFYAYSTGFGNGVGNTMNVSGIFEITSADCLCSIAFQGTAIGYITTSSFGSTITTANTAALDIYNSTLSTGALQALTHNSTTAMDLADVTINTSNATAIGGTGTINYGSVTFLDSNVIAGTTTQTLTSILKTGEIHSENIQDQTFSGFLEFTGAGSIYTVAVTTFTLDRPGTGYIKGKKVHWLGGQNTGALAVSDTYWVYIDDTGTLGTANARTNALYEDNIVLFLVLVDASSNVIVVGENHPYTFPVESSNWAHFVVGTVIANQLGGANITLNGTKAIEIDGADQLEDHGLVTVIPDSGGVAEVFNFMFTDGAGDWDRDSQANTFPSEYNNAGVIAALGASKYGIFRLFVSKDDLETGIPVYYAIFDNAQYNNLTQAQTAIANNTPATSTNELFDLEMAQLGFVIKEESTDTIVDVIIEKSVAGTQTSMPPANQASLVTTNTANFDGWLSATDTTVQAALETLDELSSAFLAYNSADDVNQTGNGAVVTVDFDTELLDQNDDFAADVFTAPKTGRYRFSASVMMTALNASTTTNLLLVTTAGSFILGTANPTAGANAAGAFTISGTILVPMAATNTAYITLQNTGAGADNNTIMGSASPYETWFSGSTE